MTVPDVVWHDAECGGYAADLPLWRSLADACGGPVLDVGAGTGRVALDLAAHGHDVLALDNEPDLLAALDERAAARDLTSIQTHCADARTLDGVEGAFPLIIVPMQTVQLFGGREGRRAFLRAVKPKLAPGGLLAMALADALGAFDHEFDGLPSADEQVVDGTLYSSQTVAITHTGEQATIHRLRNIGGAEVSDHYSIALDLLGPDELETEALMLGYQRRPQAQIAETDEYVGSTVVIVGG